MSFLLHQIRNLYFIRRSASNASKPLVDNTSAKCIARVVADLHWLTKKDFDNVSQVSSCCEIQFDILRHSMIRNGTLTAQRKGLIGDTSRANRSSSYNYPAIVVANKVQCLMILFLTWRFDRSHSFIPK